jgi:hypothetical protein
MWPFRKRTKPDTDLGREQLQDSQLENTLQYGWQDEDPDSRAVLLESLERHEEDLSRITEHQDD